MGDHLGNPGAAGMGSDIDAGQRRVGSVTPTHPNGSCVLQVSVSGRASPKDAKKQKRFYKYYVVFGIKCDNFGCGPR